MVHPKNGTSGPALVRRSEGPLKNGTWYARWRATPVPLDSGTYPSLVAVPFEGEGRVCKSRLGQYSEPGQTSLLPAGRRPRLKHVKVLKQASEVVVLGRPVLFCIQRRPHGEQLRVDADQAVKVASGVEPASGRVIQHPRPSIRVDQDHSNYHRPIIRHVENGITYSTVSDSWSDGAYDRPTSAPSGDSSRATVCPQGSILASWSIR